MRKNPPIVKPSTTDRLTRSFTVLVLAWICLLPQFTGRASWAQEAEASAAEAPAATSPVPEPLRFDGLPNDFWSSDETPVYPRGVAIVEDRLIVVDSDAHGVWSIPWPATEPASPKLLVRGTRYLRRVINRPFCAIGHPTGGVLVGDSPTREIYHVVTDASETAPEKQRITPLNDGFLGIPMALAVSPEGDLLYVGDAERRATFRLPITGGRPELVARVNARGLVFDDSGTLWAVTPDAEAVKKIDVATGDVTAIVSGRPYGFPGGISIEGDTGFVSDVYGKCIWSFTFDGKTEKWYEDDVLKGPVGLVATRDSVIVADPKNKQVYRIDRETKQIRSLFATPK
ncbi:MAG: hypothetical protein AAGD07_01695 [Planctomycetota bacterium]